MREYVNTSICRKCDGEGETADGQICLECSGQGEVECRPGNPSIPDAACNRRYGSGYCYCEAAWDRQQESLMSDGGPPAYRRPETIDEYNKQKGRK